jgi:lipooligosaccharide transport system ATP-binding protein
VSVASPPPGDGPAIAMRGFRKSFGPRVAVDRLDLVVPLGTCVGLLGPNGAGKTTTMGALCGLVRPDAGEITVLGHRLPDDGKRARGAMGVVPQHDDIDPALTVEQNLRGAAWLYRVPGPGRNAAVDDALDVARLADRRATPVDELSGGMRRRLQIARALIHHPRLILLDEPTVGLDPQLRKAIWRQIQALRDAGVAILMSTHYIEEAAQLCDTVTIMSRGRAVASGPPSALIQAHSAPEPTDARTGRPLTLEDVVLLLTTDEETA